MPRGSVEIFSHFGAYDGKPGPSRPMPIRILQSRKMPGHVNLLLNPKLDKDWIHIVEAYDIDAHDLLEALRLAGVLESYQLAEKPERHELTLFGNVTLHEGRPVSYDQIPEIMDKLNKRSFDAYLKD